MRKPELSDFGLSAADVQRAKDADFHREALQSKLLPWLFVLGPVIVGYRIYATEPSILLAAVIGFFFGGGVLALFGYAITLGLWNVIWAKMRPFDHEVLQKHKKYLAALKVFEQQQQRLLESFWSTLSGRAFEHELAQLFERLGYGVQLTPYGRDGGIDLFVQQKGKSTIVQCKRYTGPVGVAIVRELYGVLQSSEADSAILAATGGFTQGVLDFAKDKPIQLLGLREIIDLQKSVGHKVETYA